MLPTDPQAFAGYHTHKHTHPFNGTLSRTTQVSQYQKGKTNLDFSEARDSEWHSGISWAMFKSAPHSRQITMPAPHHAVFYRPDTLPAAQPTASKHRKKLIVKAQLPISKNLIYHSSSSA